MNILLGDYPIVFLLVLFRVAGVVFLLPFFGVPRGSGWLLAAASFPVALLLCIHLPDSFRDSAATLITPGDVTLALIGEFLLGAAVGAVAAAFVAIFSVAGSLCDQATSLSMAEDLDPVSGESAGILMQALRMLFIVFFLATHGHLVLIRQLAASFGSLPVPWMGWMHSGYDLARLGATTLEMGLTLAMPVMVVTFLVTIAMALMGRFAQEFNVLFLSIPFRVTSGIAMLGLSLLLGEETFRSVAYNMLTTVSRLLAL